MTTPEIQQKRYVSYLEGAIDQQRLDPDTIHTLHKDRPIWVRYDLDTIKSELDRDKLADRAYSMWRYRELLPVGNVIPPVTLGEPISPLLECPQLAQQLGMEHLLIKDESIMPTGSFKSRGLAMAITMARHFGINHVALPTAGNAGGATAHYAARAGIKATVFMPRDTPLPNRVECELAGAETILVDGLINDCGRLVREGAQTHGWFDLSTLKEPYRLEGKKTMGLELAEQLQWKLPDVILYPTGGGTGLIGMWKAFQELCTLGWLESEKMPRMICVQSSGCCPIVQAYEKDDRFAELFKNAHTQASGLRVPIAVGDFMILDAVRDSGGLAMAVDESQLGKWQRMGMSAEGISICLESAACIGALSELLQKGTISKSDQVVIFNTGSAIKCFPNIPPAHQWNA